MSYKKQNFVDGNPLYAAELNHIEDGIKELETELNNMSPEDGADGVGIQSVVQTTASSADGGTNVITVTLTNGTKSTFNVKNGSKGSKGDKGDTGANGYTPVKGTDYFTPAEIEEMIEEVLIQIGAQPVFGTVGSNNDIIINTNLADGTYILKYENADGSYTEIGELVVGSGGGPVYTNLIPTAKTHTALNTVFNGIGYKNGTYASSASPFYGTDANTVCTGCIPASVDSVFYIKGVTLNSNGHVRFGFGKDNSNGVISNHCVKTISERSSYITVETLADQYYKVTFNKDYFTTTYPDIEYMYFSAVGTGENLIVATTPIQ